MTDADKHEYNDTIGCSPITITTTEQDKILRYSITIVNVTCVPTAPNPIEEAEEYVTR